MIIDYISKKLDEVDIFLDGNFWNWM